MLVSINGTVQTHADKIHHLELNMADLYTTHNDPVDAYTNQETKIQSL